MYRYRILKEKRKRLKEQCERSAAADHDDAGRLAVRENEESQSAHRGTACEHQ